MRRRCRLCKDTVADGSMFCEKHRSQAALFSASFGPTGDEGSGGLPGGRPSRDSGVTLATPGAPAAMTAAMASIDAAGLTARVAVAFDKIRERAREHAERDANRWPQISIYCLHDRLHARPYYSIIPHNNGEALSPHSFLLTENRVLAAVSEGGDIHGALVGQFTHLRERLAHREVQTLDLHFLTYAGLICLNEHLPNQSDRNLVTFDLAGQEFVEIDAAKVHDRLRHDRW